MPTDEPTEATVSEGEARHADPEGAYLNHHVVPVPVYLVIFVALLALTGLTVWVATLELGEWNFLHTPLALAIAVVKATLVVLWFMHVRYSEKLTWVFIAVGILWLGFLIVITMADYLSRHRDATPSSWTAQAITAPGDATTAPEVLYPGGAELVAPGVPGPSVFLVSPPLP